MTIPNSPQLDETLRHAHPQVAETLQHMQRLQSTLAATVNDVRAGTFTGTDEDRTVSVTVNGEHSLIKLYIEDGLLRLGVKTVEQRLNEAITNAQAAASASVAAQQEQLFASMTEITGQLKAGIGLD